MNIFILNTGRCGSTTIMKACEYIENFTAKHESNFGEIGDVYPQNHIESDNRLSWFLGRLDSMYGNNAVYVHLYRDKIKVAQSYAKRTFKGGIFPAYRDGILTDLQNVENIDVALDYLDTVNSNIDLFLKDKTNVVKLDIDSPHLDFKKLWDMIDAEGDLKLALSEFDTPHNASKIRPSLFSMKSIEKALFKIGRLVRQFPSFIKYT